MPFKNVEAPRLTSLTTVPVERGTEMPNTTVTTFAVTCVLTTVGEMFFHVNSLSSVTCVDVILHDGTVMPLVFGNMPMLCTTCKFPFESRSGEPSGKAVPFVQNCAGLICVYPVGWKNVCSEGGRSGYCCAVTFCGSSMHCKPSVSLCDPSPVSTPNTVVNS